jgi:hypothetical protein
VHVALTQLLVWLITSSSTTYMAQAASIRIPLELASKETSNYTKFRALNDYKIFFISETMSN